MTAKVMIHFTPNKTSVPTLMALADGSIGDDAMKFNPFTGAKITSEDIAEYSDTARPLDETDISSFYAIGKCKCETIVSTINSDAANMVEYLGNVHCPECNENIRLKLSMRDRMNLASIQDLVDEDLEDENEEGDIEEMPDELTDLEDSDGDYESEESDLTDDPDSEIENNVEDDIIANAELIDGPDASESGLESDDSNSEYSTDEDSDSESDEEYNGEYDSDSDYESDDENNDEDDDENEGEYSDNLPSDLARRFKGDEKFAHLSDADIANILESIDSESKENESGETITATIGTEAPDQAIETVRLDENIKDSDIALCIDANKTKYVVMANDKPVGIIRRDLCNTDSANLFDRSVFEQAFKRILGTGGDVRSLGYRPYTVSINAKAIENKIRDRELNKMRTDVASDLENKVNRIRRGLNIAATASVKNVWPDFPNVLREKITASLAKLGIEDRSIVDVAFSQSGEEYINNLIDKAMELVDSSDIELNTTERLVNKAVGVSAPATSASRTVSRLVSGSRVIETPETPKNDTANNRASDDLSGWLDTFGAIARRK